MISRRNIRVKVMQTLYTLDTMENGPSPGEPEKLLYRHFDQTHQLFIYLFYILTEVCRYAETDSRNRSSKHLPTEADLNVNTRISGNEIMWKLLEDPQWKRAMKEMKPQNRDSGDWVRKLYLELAASPEYKAYIALEARDRKAEREILEFILGSLMLPNEDFVAMVEDQFSNWDDDAEMIYQMMQTWMQKPGTIAIIEILSAEKRDFGRNLLHTVLDKKEQTLELIKQKLKNWDPDRIAELDMILMQMGVCEFLYFETIPPKVTINEYIDIAKDYSTPQSGQFVNGILDNIHKDLVRDDKLHKVNYKPS